MCRDGAPDSSRQFDAASALDGTPFELDGVGADLALEDAFDALAHPRRLCLVAAVAEHGCGTTLEQLAATVAAREHGAPASAVDDDLRRAVYASLYHTHVPKLVDAGLLAYDADADVVVKTDETKRLEVVLAGATAALNSQRSASDEQSVD